MPNYNMSLPQIQQVDVGNFAAGYGNALNARAKQFELDEALAGRERQNALREAYPKLIAGDEAAEAEVAGVDPEFHMKWMQYKKTAKKEEIATLKAQNDMVLEASAALMNVPDDQFAGAAAQIRQRLIAQGIPPEQIPEQFDRAFVQQAYNQAVGMDKLLAAETQRRGQDITMRGQDLTSQSNALSREVQMRGQNMSRGNALIASSGGGGYTMLSPEEVKQLGLPPGSYQKSGKGEIKPINPNAMLLAPEDNSVLPQQQTQPGVIGSVEQAYGPFNVGKDIANRVLGVYPEVRAARTNAGVLREQLIEAFSKSGRPPVVEQERILQNLPSMGLLESPSGAKTSLETLKKELEFQRADDLAYSRRPDITKKARQEAKDRAFAIDRVIGTIGTGGAPSGSGNVRDEADRILGGG